MLLNYNFDQLIKDFQCFGYELLLFKIVTQQMMF